MMKKLLILTFALVLMAPATASLSQGHHRHGVVLQKADGGLR